MFYLLVGPAHHRVPCCLERSCPYFITIGLITMNRPIDFDNQTPLWTAEIDDKAPERMLAPEFEPLEPAITQMLPQPRFCQRLLASKLASAHPALQEGMQFGGREVIVIAPAAELGDEIQSIAALRQGELLSRGRDERLAVGGTEGLAQRLGREAM